jgi:zinc protease
MYEPVKHAGLTALAARASTKGTTTRNAMQIAESSELLGGSVASSVGAEHFGWSISVPLENTMPALALLSDVVQHATFSDDSIVTERTALLSDLAQLRDDMYRYPMRLATMHAFVGHPYGMPTIGTEASLQAITSDDVRAWYRENLCRAPFVIGVVGDIDPDQIASAVAGAFGELVMEDAHQIVAPTWPQGIVESTEQREKAQTALAIAFPSPTRRDPDRFAAHLLTTITSGLGGRFFDELRDRQSLAYTVHAFAAEYQLAGMLVSYIATSPDRESVARDGLLREFEKLREEPVSDEELTRAKQYVLGLHDIRQERGGAVLSDMVDAWLLGTGLQELSDFTERVNAVTASDIQQLACRYFDPARRVEGIVRGVGA